MLWLLLGVVVMRTSREMVSGVAVPRLSGLFCLDRDLEPNEVQASGIDESALNERSGGTTRLALLLSRV